MTGRVGLIVDFEVSAADAAAFHAALAEERAAVAALEPGCVLFDVLLFDEAGRTGAIVEVFESADARESHRRAAHVAQAKAVFANLDVRLSKREGRALPG
jgi:quinol monooxygenase YgiN